MVSLCRLCYLHFCTFQLEFTLALNPYDEHTARTHENLAGQTIERACSVSARAHALTVIMDVTPSSKFFPKIT